jgi:CRP-like cAMP-binding protein
VYDVAMGHDDWKKMRSSEIFEKKTYLLGEKVVRQNDVSSKIFQIESGSILLSYCDAQSLVDSVAEC